MAAEKTAEEKREAALVGKGRCSGGKCKERLVAQREEPAPTGTLFAYRCEKCGFTRIVRGSGKLYAPGTEPVWAAVKEAEPKAS